ncbi:uncharacterized protein N7487_008708 [Penicillium crustosum]|uniref:uncharacterized protein n=1 Tax=Penicillium crustosum TaxID=36656 RepID=UPI0023A59C69|nr:uncharacterized protein N7487_008708 [Penicillium crustosum]KAJ5402812.1 hypothetical protein N7487_008708 [Penicillium crustosum]
MVSWLEGTGFTSRADMYARALSRAVPQDGEDLCTIRAAAFIKRDEFAVGRDRLRECAYLIYLGAFQGYSTGIWWEAPAPGMVIGGLAAHVSPQMNYGNTIGIVVPPLLAICN